MDRRGLAIRKTTRILKNTIKQFFVVKNTYEYILVLRKFRKIG